MLTVTILLLWRTLVKISQLFTFSLPRNRWVSIRKREVLTPELDPINLIVWLSDLRSHKEIDDE